MSATLTSRAKPQRRALVWEAVKTYSYVLLWITLSAAVILYNKWVLTHSGFKYAIALTMWHMAFCSGLATLLVRGGFVEPANISRDLFLKGIVPISGLFAGTLWLGNAAYLYLEVSFVQMLKALMPVAVFLVGCTMGTEMFSTATLINMLVVSGGVAIASLGASMCKGGFRTRQNMYWSKLTGEVNFVVTGVLLQLLSIMTESTRLTLVQILLQRRGVKLNPVSTLYYVAPCSLAFLIVPFICFDLPKMMEAEYIPINPAVLLSNALAAFALNMSVFLLIGKTSALTMNVAGVVKDWLLIGLSWLLFGSPVTQLNLFGYGIAFSAVAWYNHRKLVEARNKATAGDKAQHTLQKLLPTAGEKKPQEA